MTLDASLSLIPVVLQVTEVIHDDGSPTEKTFEHVPTEIGAEEAEEVGGGWDDSLT